MTVLGIGSLFMATLPAWSAEHIQFFYGPFEPTIYVEDLKHLAETGEVPERLDHLTHYLNNEQLASLQAILNIRLDVTAVTVSQFTYGPMGERLIEQVGQVVQTDNFLNGASAIRAASILAAADDDGLSIINMMQHFPLETIQVDLPLFLQILEENQQIFHQLDTAVTNLRQLAETQADDTLAPINLGLHQAGPYSWKMEVFRFQNPNRVEVSVADLYLPIKPSVQQIPVVVISHGTASNRQTLAYLATHFASHGYAVVVPEHAETSKERFERFLNGLEGAPDPADILYRPRDITAVLDTLQQKSRTNPALRPLDLNSVGVLGQSLGGYTALAAAGARLNSYHSLAEACATTLPERPALNLSMLIQCRLLDVPFGSSLSVQDERVNVAIAINPITSHVFGQSGLGALDVPTLIVSGTDDYFAPALPEQIEPFQWINSTEKSLLIVENGTHFSFLDGDNQGVFPVPDAMIGPTPALAKPPLKAVSLAFLNRYLIEQNEAEPQLNQAYLETFETDPFQLTLVRHSEQ